MPSPLPFGPPSPFASPAHARVAARLAQVFVDAASWETETDDGRLFARLVSTGLWSEIVTPFAHAGTKGRDVTAFAMLREGLAPLSARADALVGVQGLVLATADAALEAAPTTSERAASLAVLREFRDGIAQGRLLGAFALTEPEAGSDLHAVTTTAAPAAGGYILRGTKTFISCASVASAVLVLARVPESDSHLDLFLVRRDTPGVGVASLTLLAPHDIGSLVFDGVVLKDDARVSHDGRGLAFALSALTIMRSTVGAAALGLGARALEETRAFLQTRRAFGRPLAANDALRARLADHVTAWEAARLLVYRATWLASQPLPPGQDRHESRRERDERARAASLAKLHATEAAQRIVDDAVQMHGARGVLEGEVVARLYREVRSLRIYEGTSEIQRTLIARAFFGDKG